MTGDGRQYQEQRQSELAFNKIEAQAPQARPASL